MLNLIAGERLGSLPNPNLSRARGTGTTDGWMEVPSMGWELLILCTPTFSGDNEYNSET